MSICEDYSSFYSLIKERILETMMHIKDLLLTRQNLLIIIVISGAGANDERCDECVREVIVGRIR